MNLHDQPRPRRCPTPSVGLVLAALILPGCKGIPTQGERRGRADLQAVSSVFRPQPTERSLPALSNTSTLGDYLRFAMLNQPSVEAAYYDWMASVQRITVDRLLPDPPQPTLFETTPLDLNGDALFDTAIARNPRLRAMESDVRLAEAAVALARTSKVPDFSLGLMPDATAAPTMFRPLAGRTLPIWRDKIAAQVAQAQANNRTAQARLTSEQIMVTVDFAIKSYDYREVTRNLALLQRQLIPKARESLEVAQAGYLSDRTDVFDLLDAERTLRTFQLEEVESRTRRNIVLADLSVPIAGISPEGAPVLNSESNTPTRAKEE